MHLEDLVDAARDSDFFTAPKLEADLPRFLDEQAERIRQLARRTAAGEFEHVYFVGNGGSWSNMYSGKYLLDRLTTVPADVLQGYELIWRDPPRLNGRALVFVASYSGSTEDALAALRHANARGAHTVAIVNRHPSPMAAEAVEVIDYDSVALYVLPLAAVTLFALELAVASDGPGRAEAEAALAGLRELPAILKRAYREAEAPGLDWARQFLGSTMLYVLASGPNYGLGYKFALTVFMENIRVNGSIIEAAELRHGPIEAFERQRADVVALVGTDESRELTLRSVKAAEAAGARVLALDAADFPGLHPLLAPFVLIVPLEWFTVHSALLRGILDLDERVFMGHRLLAAGPDATWP
ncbi:MAG: putative phosphosugar isomerase [Chloroflexi bacterium]|nr:putative phosphosugar isomerase [Chloroflexota bacterium]